MSEVEDTEKIDVELQSEDLQDDDSARKAPTKWHLIVAGVVVAAVVVTVGVFLSIFTSQKHAGKSGNTDSGTPSNQKAGDKVAIWSAGVFRAPIAMLARNRTWAVLAVLCCLAIIAAVLVWKHYAPSQAGGLHENPPPAATEDNSWTASDYAVAAFLFLVLAVSAGFCIWVGIKLCTSNRGKSPAEASEGKAAAKDVARGNDNKAQKRLEEQVGGAHPLSSPGQGPEIDKIDMELKRLIIAPIPTLQKNVDPTAVTATPKVAPPLSAEIENALVLKLNELSTVLKNEMRSLPKQNEEQKHHMFYLRNVDGKREKCKINLNSAKVSILQAAALISAQTKSPSILLPFSLESESYSMKPRGKFIYFSIPLNVFKIGPSDRKVRWLKKVIDGEMVASGQIHETTFLDRLSLDTIFG